VVCGVVSTYLEQQLVDLFTNLDVRVYVLASVKSRCCKHVFIHRTPEEETQRPSARVFKVNEIPTTDDKSGPESGASGVLTCGLCACR